MVGAANSSNSQRLREVAEREGCSAQLVADETCINWPALARVGSVAVTAGASAPETLVQRVLEALHAHYEVSLETLTTASEFDGFSSAARAARAGGSESRLLLRQSALIDVDVLLRLVFPDEHLRRQLRGFLPATHA